MYNKIIFKQLQTRILVDSIKNNTSMFKYTRPLLTHSFTKYKSKHGRGGRGGGITSTILPSINI